MSMCFTFFSWETTDVKNMIVVGSCYFLLTLLIPYDPNIDFVFPLNNLCYNVLYWLDYNDSKPFE